MKLFDPILTPSESGLFESRILGGSEDAAFSAMKAAGEAAAKMFLEEFSEMLPSSPRILALVGNGHNGGDALVFLHSLCERFPEAKATLVANEARFLKNNTKRALARLLSLCDGKNVPTLPPALIARIASEKFDLIVDGISGMSFKPPARPDTAREIETANKIEAKIKISIDIPSGASNEPNMPIFHADATYAVGICKTPLFKPFNREFVGRIRYVDIGFFDKSGFWGDDTANKTDFITRPDALEFLNSLRPSLSDKRSNGHLFVLAGSKTFPGAAMLAVKSALRSGVGLVSAFVPESLAPAFAAAEPSAIWTGCPEDESGALALESYSLIRHRLDAATCLLAGPGMTSSSEARALTIEILKSAPSLPAVIDADAICRPVAELLLKRGSPALLTPHEGEILKIAEDASDKSLLSSCLKYGCSIALKSSATRVSDGKIIVRQTRGSPALARGGSGDILAGIAGALLANKSHNFENPALEAGVCASQTLGLAAEKAAAKFGETSVSANDIPNYIHFAIRRACG